MPPRPELQQHDADALPGPVDPSSKAVSSLPSPSTTNALQRPPRQPATTCGGAALLQQPGFLQKAGHQQPVLGHRPIPTLAPARLPSSPAAAEKAGLSHDDVQKLSKLRMFAHLRDRPQEVRAAGSLQHLVQRASPLDGTRWHRCIASMQGAVLHSLWSDMTARQTIKRLPPAPVPAISPSGQRQCSELSYVARHGIISEVSCAASSAPSRPSSGSGDALHDSAPVQSAPVCWSGCSHQAMTAWQLAAGALPGHAVHASRFQQRWDG